MNTRLVLFILSAFLLILSLGMLIPAIWDGIAGNPDWLVFTVATVMTAFIAVVLGLSNSGGPKRLHVREAFVMTTLVWIVLAFFAALPFMFGELNLSFTDAYFEAMSGLTTTGSTVITGLDHLPPGILLWRAILQWLGGLGIIVMAVSIMPLLRSGGMQMFRIEAFDTSGADLPRATDISLALTGTYVFFTLVCAVALDIAGMTWLEALTHAMTTIATGGYSTSDGSIGHFDNAVIDAIITAGMVVGGIPFLLFVRSFRGKPDSLLKDSQVRCYLGLLGLSTLLITGWLVTTQHMPTGESLRYASFSVASIMTGTGYAGADYTTWGAFPVGYLFFLTFVGGCAGSTACGMKIFRFQILAAATRSMLNRLIHPHGVFVPHYNGSPVSEEVIASVLGFFFLFVAIFAGLSVALVATGLDFITAVSGAATAISNVGPGLGPTIGPSGTFQSLPDTAKWLLAAGMLIGRLEVFSVVILLLPAFWRR